MIIGYAVFLCVGLIIISLVVLSIRRRRGAYYNRVSAAPSEHLESPALQYSYLQKYWLFHGRYCARHPYIVILLCIVFTGVCATGISRLVIQQEPEKLWTPPDSRSELDKNYFDEHFGPFFRVEQMIITSKIPGQQIISLPFLEQILEIQYAVEAIKVNVNGKTITLADLCFKPIPGQGCLIESVTEFWQNNITKLRETKNIIQYVQTCSGATTIPSCMSEIGSPVDPFIVFGGFDINLKNYINSTALVVTFLLENQPSNLDYAFAWEKEFLKIASQNYELINIAYSAEVKKKKFLKHLKF